MLPFLQLPYRKAVSLEKTRELKPVVIAAVLFLLLLAQIGLVLWIYFHQ